MSDERRPKLSKKSAQLKAAPRKVQSSTQPKSKPPTAQSRPPKPPAGND